jgi:hypothetical protein
LSIVGNRVRVQRYRVQWLTKNVKKKSQVRGLAFI